MSRKKGRTQLPQAMLARFEEMGLDLDQFVPALLSYPTPSFRINPLKGEQESVLESLSGIEPEPVGWNRLVFRANPGEIKLGNLLEHFLGQIYVQDTSSTIPVTVLDPQPGEEILDMTAAPGSKTTQIAAAMGNKGLLLANEVSAKRTASLTGNLDRCGVINAVVTNQPGQAYGHLAPERFDRILLDAPCSSEGTLSRNLRGLDIWSENSIKRLAKLQGNLILSAYYSLRPGGLMVYSTCTFAPEENEGTVTRLLEKFPDAVIEPIELQGINGRPGFPEWRDKTFHPSARNILRLFPHEHDGEGFCIAKIRKPSSTVTETAKPDKRLPSKHRPGRGNAKSIEKEETEIVKKTLASLEERFGIRPQSFEDFRLFIRKNDVWCSTQEAGEVQFPRITRRGLRIARAFEHSVRFTTNAVQLFGHLVTRNRIELDEQKTRLFLAGKTQDVEQPQDATDGFVVAFNSGCALGIGLLKEGKLKSQVPRSRRVIG